MFYVWSSMGGIISGSILKSTLDTFADNNCSICDLLWFKSYQVQCSELH